MNHHLQVSAQMTFLPPFSKQWCASGRCLFVPELGSPLRAWLGHTARLFHLLWPDCRPIRGREMEAVSIR